MKTPASPALAGLPWRQLLRRATDFRSPAGARHRAEESLSSRIPDMALGEKVTLAHGATRRLIPRLLDEQDAKVLRAVACNGRVTESDLLRVLDRPGAPRAFLEWLAAESPWKDRFAIRRALILHPATPARASLRLLRGLSRSALHALRDEQAPQLVRMAAERAIAAGNWNPLRRLDPVDTDSHRFLQSPAGRVQSGKNTVTTRTGDR